MLFEESLSIIREHILGLVTPRHAEYADNAEKRG